MAICLKAVSDLTALIGAQDAADVLHLAKAQDRIETKWRKKFEAEIKRITEELLKEAEKTGQLDFSQVDFEELVMRHSFEVMEQGFKSAKKPVRTTKFAAPPKRIPKSLKTLREMWDFWRKKKKIPPRQKDLAERIKKAYCDKVQSVWVKYGDAFRTGQTASRAEAVEKIIEGADVAYSRAKMIVETETTFYYNQARREIYDQSDDVTHYLFMAIRDHATTAWCKSRKGLVYSKADPILNDETPPIHWNCRSELLPLTPLNPNHAKLIADDNIQRRGKKCEPLPPGWGGRRKS